MAMVKVTLGDAFRVYIKPSLGGRLVIRKRNTIHYSERVKARQRWVAERKPGKIAREKCEAAGKVVGGRCPIKYFRVYLREAMKGI